MIEFNNRGYLIPPDIIETDMPTFEQIFLFNEHRQAIFQEYNQLTMEQEQQSSIHKILPDILNRIERYEQGVQRHQNAQKPSKLAIAQYEELRDEMIAFVLDYLVEMGGSNALKTYMLKTNMLKAA